MPVATITVRKLKNESSGLDLSIPNVKEIPGILIDTVEYNVLVVSNLQFFKLPQHRESDVVQFVIPKRFEDFENLRKGLSSQYLGTVLPNISSSILSTLFESNITDRTQELEEFLKFIALSPKLATCHLTLEFLGVNPVTAGKYTTGAKPNNDLVEQKKSATGQPLAGHSQLFEEESEESSDLFGSETGKETTADEEIFSSGKQSAFRGGRAKLFEDSFGDFDTAADADDMKMFRLDALDSTKSAFTADTEDVSDLLDVEDDITKLLKLEEEVKSKQKKHSGETVQPLSPSSLSKPSLPPKPVPGKKPVVPQKPSDKVSAVGGGTRKASDADETSLELGVDDILNYIKDHPMEKEEEPELF